MAFTERYILAALDVYDCSVLERLSIRILNMYGYKKDDKAEAYNQLS